jgi:hypothetical protein
MSSFFASPRRSPSEPSERGGPPPPPPPACAHDGQLVEGGGALACARCGLVLQDRLFEDAWTPPVRPRRTSDDDWRRALRLVLARLGVAADPDSFPRPLDDAEVAEAQRRLRCAVRLRSLAGCAVLLRFPGCLSSEEAREACEASAQEWRAACALLGGATAAGRGRGWQDEEDRLWFARQARRLQLPPAVAGAALRASQEPRLECCDRRKLLVACAAESLGDGLAAELFAEPEEAVRALRQKYRLAAFAADLTAPARALQLCLERCEQASRRAREERAELLARGFVQPWWHGVPTADTAAEADASPRRHLSRCAGCTARAQELGLGFLAALAANDDASSGREKKQQCAL